MKKLALWLALLLAVSTLAFAEPDDGDARLMEAADQAVRSMLSVVSIDGYVKQFSADGDLDELAAQTLACSYDAPVRASVIAMRADSLQALCRVLLGAGQTDAETMELVQMRMYNVLPSMLNARRDMLWLALTSALSVSDVRTLDGVEPGAAYVIYEYADPEQPMTYASFYIKENGLALSTAGFVQVDEETRAALFSAELGALREELGSTAAAMIGSALTQHVYDLTED